MVKPQASRWIGWPTTRVHDVAARPRGRPRGGTPRAGALGPLLSISRNGFPALEVGMSADEHGAVVRGRDPLLTVQQAAECLAVSVAHLRRLIRQRRLPIHRIGRLVRGAPDDLAAFLAKTRRGAR
jgi:excisionase family DNA binding protein